MSLYPATSMRKVWIFWNKWHKTWSFLVTIWWDKSWFCKWSSFSSVLMLYTTIFLFSNSRCRPWKFHDFKSYPANFMEKVYLVTTLILRLLGQVYSSFRSLPILSHLPNFEFVFRPPNNWSQAQGIYHTDTLSTLIYSLVLVRRLEI